MDRRPCNWCPDHKALPWELRGSVQQQCMANNFIYFIEYCKLLLSSTESDRLQLWSDANDLQYQLQLSINIHVNIQNAFNWSRIIKHCGKYHRVEFNSTSSSASLLSHIKYSPGSHSTLMWHYSITDMATWHTINHTITANTISHLCAHF